MNLFERPPERSARWWAFDVLVALGVAGLSVPEWSRAMVSPRILVAVAGLIVFGTLIFRRVRPVEVFAVLLVVSVVGAVLSSHLANGVGLLVALYTVVASRPRRQGLLATAALEAGAAFAALRMEGLGFWTAWIFLSGLVAAALSLGLYVATRRVYLRELQDHAARLERERDQDAELAAVTERSRIAREMHDIVAHNLTVMVALSDGAAATAGTAPDRAAEVMRTVSETGRQALADTRRLLGVLSDESGSGRHPMPGLDGLDDLVAGVRAAGLPVSYEVSGAARAMPPSAQLTVYRLVQEALTNTLKHGGQVNHAVVRLEYRPGELHLKITDDGLGASRPGPASSGRGLAGMRERVLAVGGQVQTGPRSPVGWQVSARLPTGDAPTDGVRT